MREILQFWRAVEMFSPQAIPPARVAENVFDLAAGGPMPWDADHPVQRIRLAEDQVWRHTVYVGLFPREAMFSALGDVFPASTDSYEERPSGESALLAFGVSATGTLLEGSTVLSEAAWATARALSPGPTAAGWLDGFEEFAVEFATQQEEIYLRGEDGARKPLRLDWAALSETLDAAIAALGVAEVLPVSGIRVSSAVARRGGATVERDFLNSFIAEDLARVSAAAARGDVGGALRDYL